MASDTYHEPFELLTEETKNLHRAVVTLIEELEAVDWYQQRADVCSDGDLRAVLIHNRDEEIEHAMMTLEWLRRNHPVFAHNIATYLNSTGSIVEAEDAHRQADSKHREPSNSASQSLGIAALRGAK